MAERIVIGGWMNKTTQKNEVGLYVDDGVCDVCHEKNVVLGVATANPMFSGCVCVKCIVDGFELFSIKNRRQMPVLMYKDTLASKAV